MELKQWQQEKAAKDRLSTGIEGLDELFGPPGLTRGAVHELLHPTPSRPMFPAMLLAKAAAGLPASPRLAPSLLADPVAFAATPELLNPKGVIVISDPQRQLYPPAAAQLGIPLSHLYLLHPRTREEELWALSECLSSPEVSAVVAHLGKLSQIEARRLQLAAERTGAMGLFMRPNTKVSAIYAAATRLAITPQATTSACQSWKIQLVHGHGGQVGKSLTLEYNRETHTLRTIDELARVTTAAQTPPSRAIA